MSARPPGVLRRGVWREGEGVQVVEKKDPPHSDQISPCVQQRTSHQQITRAVGLSSLSVLSGRHEEEGDRPRVHVFQAWAQRPPRTCAASGIKSRATAVRLGVFCFLRVGGGPGCVLAHTGFSVFCPEGAKKKKGKRK